MHRSSLEQGSGEGGYKPPSLLCPFLGPGAAGMSGSTPGVQPSPIPAGALSAANSRLMTLVTHPGPRRDSGWRLFSQKLFFHPGPQEVGKGLIPSWVPQGSWHGCGPTIPWSPLSPAPQDVAVSLWECRWQVVMGKLLRHGDIHTTPPPPPQPPLCWGHWHPASLSHHAALHHLLVPSLGNWWPGDRQAH